MKILYILIVALLLSCQGAPKNIGNPLEFPAFNRDLTILLFPEKGAESQRLTLFISFPEIPGGRVVEDSVNAVLYEGNTPQVYADTVCSSYKERYESIRAYVEDSETANWSYIEEIRVVEGEHTETIDGRVKKPLLQIKRTVEEYTGGAHPSHSTQFYVFDAQSGQRFSLGDIVRDAEALLQSVEASLCRDKGVAPGTPLNDAGITFSDREHLDVLPDNFFLTAEGIGFHWNEYEIAPYSAGQIETVVPYGDVQF